ncbi:MAG: hypothetical protein Q4G52_07250 [Clostridia bacterium]|nr:hypothetical protein [Clostridia bacterium]
MAEFFDGFEGIHIANIASYILDDASLIELPVDSFNERIDEADEELKETLSELIKDDKTRRSVSNALTDNGSVVRDVFFEAGILCGLKLAKTLATDTEQYTDLIRRYSKRD